MIRDPIRFDPDFVDAAMQILILTKIVAEGCYIRQKIPQIGGNEYP